MSCMLATHIPARRHSCAQASSYSSLFVHHHRLRRDVTALSDSKGQGNAIQKPDSEPAPSRDTGGQQLGPQASDPSEGSGNEQPPDQRPMLVRIIMSVFRTFWQSLGRVWEVLPGSKAFRLGFCLFVLALYNTMRGPSGASAAAPVEVLYSQFVQLAKAKVIHSALVDDQSSVLYFSIDQAKLRHHASGKKRWWRNNDSSQASVTSKSPSGFRSFSTRLVDKDTSYVQVLIDSGVPFGVKKQTLEGAISRLAGAFLALWIPLIPFFFLFKRVMDSQSGKSKKTKQNYEPPDTTFDDVAGVDVVKAELQEAVQCLRDPARFEKLNAQMPSGVLLTGPPGTGKTLLARAVAGEAGVPFFAVSASEFVEMFVGRGAARIRELFAQARKASPAVVFIDELDAVGGKRGLGVNDERDQTLNQLLTELDGFEKRPSILLLAATNRPEVLDQALLRPGRISRRIVVPLPDEAGRQSILRVHLRGVPMEDDEAKDQAIGHLAAITPGFSGAELFNVVNEGALLTARRSGEHVRLTDLVMGVQRTRDGVNGRPPVFSAAAERLAGLLKGKNEPARASPMF